MKEIIKAGHIFKIRSRANGKVALSYEGKENDFRQWVMWICDDEAEAMDMIEAVLDPDRYADDEHTARHWDELCAGCKW